MELNRVSYMVVRDIVEVSEGEATSVVASRGDCPRPAATAISFHTPSMSAIAETSTC